MSFESNMENYKDTMSSIMGGELAASAQRIAEGADLGEEARQATGQVLGPLALDMLKEGIMAKAGVSSALGRAAPTDLKGLVQAGLKDGLDHLKGKALEAAKARGLPTTKEDLLAAGKNKLASVVKGQTGVDITDITSSASPVSAVMGKARAAAGDLKTQASNLAEVATSGKADLVTTAKGFASRGGPSTPAIAPPAVAPKEEEEEEEDEDEPAFIGASGRDITPPEEEQVSPQDLIDASKEVLVNPNAADSSQLRSSAADIFKSLNEGGDVPVPAPSAGRAIVQSEEG